ncbi:MAG: sugar transferase [Actinomycetota bacterium]|nr:sugar transferase [Actinomycetota bacterium]
MQVTQYAAQMVAAGGQALVIWLPVYALLVSEVSSLRSLLAISILVTIVWLLALRAAFAAARLTLLALGPVVAAALGTGTGLVAASAVTLWVPGLRVTPGRMLLIAGSVFVLSAAWEALVYRSIASSKRVLVVGARGGGAELVEELAQEPDSPFNVIGFVDNDLRSDKIAGVPLFGGIDQLAAVVDAELPDLVVLTSDDQRPETINQLLDAVSAGFRVVSLQNFYEHAFGRVPIRHLTPVWFMSVLHLYQRPYNRLTKRALDIVVSSVGLLVTALLFPFIALAIKRTKGPLIYKQKRPGENGRLFTIYKFRTMRTDVETPGGETLAEESDSRIIRPFGPFLRRRRLDELPQLWNVLKGDMSVVGPRPEPDFVIGASEDIPFWIRRRMVKPGITGWAQVRRGYTGADAESVTDKLSYDLWYLRHRSLFLDLAICVKTFSTLLSGAGAR